MKKALFIIVLGLLSSSAMACQFNTDCSPGSQCYKPNGGLYGYCVGGLQPGNSYDKGPKQKTWSNMRDSNKGRTCSFNTDCDFGQQCIKGSGIYGTCL